jgi:hypothetical protein
MVAIRTTRVVIARGGRRLAAGTLIRSAEPVPAEHVELGCEPGWTIPHPWYAGARLVVPATHARVAS